MFDERHFRKYVCETPSELGLEVAQLLDDLVGFHNIQFDLVGKVDWTNGHHIVIPWPKHINLATFDYDLLTKLVVYSHDRMLRIELNPRHFRWVELVFHKRKREGRYLYERMPTMEEHIKVIRGEP